MNPQNENSTPEKVAVVEAAYAAYAAEDYVLPDKLAKDHGKIRERIFEVLAGAKVLGKNERADKAITRGTLVERVLPHLPGPEKFSEQDDPQLAQAVWNKIDQELWSICTPGAGSAMQRLVGLNMGNGYVMCRTTVSRDQTDALYITDDFQCIMTDFVQPGSNRLSRAVRAVTADQEMLIYRQPDNGKRYASRYNNTLKQLAAAATGQIALAVESASEPTGNDED